ncbi:MAG: PaaI family thioesterase [Bacteroidota bacterium]|nr:PaaI family thioesterase [Bacteroidota bacterium]
MIKLKNPYAEFPGYSCFACGPTNPSGLHMEFYKDNDEIVSKWDPIEHYQGFHDLLHGGIQATMMDEIASWVVFLMLDTAGVTYRLNTRFRKPVYISKGIITVRASLVQHQKRIAEIEARLYDGSELLCAEGVANYFVMPRDKAVNDFHFPGKEAFLKQT